MNENKEIEEMATIADNINNSWNRVSLTFEGTGTSLDALKEKIADVKVKQSLDVVQEEEQKESWFSKILRKLGL